MECGVMIIYKAKVRMECGVSVMYRAKLEISLWCSYH